MVSLGQTTVEETDFRQKSVSKGLEVIKPRKEFPVAWSSRHMRAVGKEGHNDFLRSSGQTKELRPELGRQYRATKHSRQEPRNLK